MTEATIVVPMLPPPECSPNARPHWTQKRRAAREFRRCAGYATIDWFSRGSAGAGFAWLGHGVVMDVEVAWCCGRKRMDDDNCWASLKACRDGIADVLFGGDDRLITQGELIQSRGSGTVTVRLREQDASRN